MFENGLYFLSLADDFCSAAQLPALFYLSHLLKIYSREKDKGRIANPDHMLLMRSLRWLIHNAETHETLDTWNNYS